ncbi:26S proteasome non-ATPase-like protein regulatory subunit 9 [Dipodascopsis uninucleata]
MNYPISCLITNLNSLYEIDYTAPAMDIHSPTIRNSNHKDSSGNYLRDLIAQRKELEDKLNSLGEVLESHGADMNTALLTPEGFPRQDIDIAQIRITRAQIIRLKNDHKALMRDIEYALYDHHAQIQENTRNNVDIRSLNGSGEAYNIAFAVVNSVAPNSPAFEAGLAPGDRIMKFGDAHAGNHQRLSRLSTIVQQSENSPIEILIYRQIEEAGAHAEINISLTPREGWGGRGMLGCHILPL